MLQQAFLNIDELSIHSQINFGVPPKGNANFAWVQHFIHHLAPGGAGTAGGMAGFVLANGRMSSNQSGEGDIRRVSY